MKGNRRSEKTCNFNWQNNSCSLPIVKFHYYTVQPQFLSMIAKMSCSLPIVKFHYFTVPPKFLSIIAKGSVSLALTDPFNVVRVFLFNKPLNITLFINQQMSQQETCPSFQIICQLNYMVATSFLLISNYSPLELNFLL